MMHRDDLIGQFQDGHKDAFEQLWGEHFPRLLWEIGRVAIVYDDVQELLQQTRVEVYKARHTYMGKGTIGSWIGGVCRRCCLRWVRSAQCYRKRIDDFAIFADVLVDPEVEVEAFELEHEVRCRHVELALSRLTERQRRVVELRSIHDKSVADVADQLQCSAGTVKATYHKALAHLRADLASLEAREHLDQSKPI